MAIAVAARCRGLLTAAEGDVEAALGPVDDAVRAQRQLPNPLELGRTLVLKGRVHRRRKEKRAAREAFVEALAIFERLGAPLWAERTAAELARLGGRPPAPMELTATEQRELRQADPKSAGEVLAEAGGFPPELSWEHFQQPGGGTVRAGRGGDLGDRTDDGRSLIRLPEPKVRPEVEARRKAGADILRPDRGRYVGQKDDQVLIDADSPYDVVNWLRDQGVEGAVVFRVPLDPTVDILTAAGPTDPPPGR